VGQALRDGPERSDGTELTVVRVEKLVPGGAGMCRFEDGTVGFVEGAFPGETLRPLATVKQKDYAKITRFELVKASSERVEAACPVADACGGCDWMKLERAAELHHKSRIVAEALQRTGGIRLDAAPDIVTAGPELGYRSRIRLHVDPRGRVGFHARGTHALVEVPGCPVAEPEVERGIVFVRSLASEMPGAMARFESVEIRALDAGGLELVLHPLENSGRTPDSTRLVERLRELGSVTLSRGSSEFSQVNRAVNAVLVAAVVDGAVARHITSFVDLYAGSANFGVPLARAGMSGISVEGDAKSAASGRERAAREAFGRLEVRSEDVTRALAELSRAKRRFELVVLDPPRSGAKAALSGILALEPCAIAYVACDPVTLARDARELVGKGFTISGVTCFDMFPKTHHVETLAWLERT
jgi:23S rRNA (uracil1939-C5)-methyltransferase